jgi:Flp pilus assembly protein TadD
VHDEQAARFDTNVGLGKLEAGDVIAALDLFRRATLLFADYAPAHYHMGLALERLGRSREGQQALARARALNPNLAPLPERR